VEYNGADVDKRCSGRARVTMATGVCAASGSGMNDGGHGGVPTIGVFCTGKNRVVKITCSSSEVVLQTTKHTMIYHGSGPSLEVIALRPTV
jgi:hypothetical protein